ncbi:hypothetical protein K450DRAFT_230843 [Umbelopsis ramanniana AG]|uniref:RPEL repeat protein n=1 Tax=Umbelopsis ramanniana AG TaxID=1314678 RepID=A0AAD5HH17_UMBRA|nr:uncharacterized protein K450DRAFT_230843 [Umbelopsis ramanniana AG]KAI8581718.1 hypothetical protein K450DRAFT_230843 [Umbelopsis ramanniana AG]
MTKSPVTSPAAEKLDAFLSHRPDQQELVEKNILKDPKIAPSLQQHREELAKRQIEDSLRHKIEARPKKEDLVEHNILKNTTAAPAIQAQQAELQRSRLQNALEHKMQERPQPDQLIKQGILPAESAPQ